MTTRRRKALIFVGASEPQIDAIRAARDAGLHVVATDQSNSAPGRSAADEFHQVSATDTQGLLSLASRLTASHELVGAYGVADYANDAVGTILELCAVKGIESAAFRRAADKSDCRERWVEAGLPVARGVVLEANEDPKQWFLAVTTLGSSHVVVKPASAYNSHGVRTERVDAGSDLLKAIQAAFVHTDRVVVEGRLEGRHVNVDGIMVEGDFHPIVTTQRGFRDARRNEAAFGIQPAEITAEEAGQLCQLTEQAARAIGLLSAPVTADLVLGDDGPAILEISPHLHAVSATALLDNGRGLRGWFSYLAGDEAWRETLAPGDFGDRTSAYVYVYATSLGVVRRISALAKVRNHPNVARVILRKAVGSEVTLAAGRAELGAMVLLCGRTRAALEDTIGWLRTTMRFEVEGADHTARSVAGNR